MKPIFLDAIAFCLAYASMAALCLAMPRHHDDVLGGDPPLRRARALRAVGWTLLALALWSMAAAHGWGYGLAQWAGLLALAGLALIATLPYAPRAAAGLGLACLALAPVLLAL